MGRRQVVNVYMLSFAHIMNHEATKPVRVTVLAQTRECKSPSAPGEVFVKAFSDRGSTPLISTTPETPIDTMCQFGVSFFYTLKALRRNASSFLPLQYVYINNQNWALKAC